MGFSGMVDFVQTCDKLSSMRAAFHVVLNASELLKEYAVTGRATGRGLTIPSGGVLPSAGFPEFQKMDAFKAARFFQVCGVHSQLTNMK